MLGEVNGKAREKERDHNGRGQRYRSAVYARAFATEHTTGQARPRTWKVRYYLTPLRTQYPATPGKA